MNRRAPTSLTSAWAILFVVVLLAGCMTRSPAPVVERGPFPFEAQSPRLPDGLPGREAEVPPLAPSQTYTIKRGDTLYQIALDHGLDYRELAAWNNIENPNVIRVGQVLRLAAPGTTAESNAPVTAQEAAPGVTTAPLRGPPAVVAAAPP